MSKSVRTDVEESCKQVMAFSPVSGPFQFRARTNIVHPYPIKFFVPDDDKSVPFVFAIGIRTLSTSGGSEHAMLSGYFSALCAVLPDVTAIAMKVMENLSYTVVVVKIPSQADRFNISIPRAYESLRVENLNFALLCILPFHNNPDEVEEKFVGKVASKLAFDFPEHRLCEGYIMRKLGSALYFSGLRPELRSFIASAVKSLAETNTPVGHVLSEAIYFI